MGSDEPKKTTKVSKEEFDVISNRIAVALAQREALIKSWTASSSKPQEPSKTDEELDAEDAILFRNQPQHLGVGAPIPAEFLVNNAERNNKVLRARFFPGKGLKASKARDKEEKAASAKRGLRHESSDEEEGRSSLGKSKKRKTTSKLDDKAARKLESGSAEEDGTTILGISKEKSSIVSNQDARILEQQDDSDLEEVRHKLKKKKQRIEKRNPDVASKIEARLQELLNGGPLKEKTSPSKESQVNDEDSSAAENSPVGTASVSKSSVGPVEDRVLDPIERKKLKKREKKKRAKLRAAALALKD